MFRYYYYCLRKAVEIFRRRILKSRIKRYAGRAVMDEERGGEEIVRLIESGKPFVAARFGSTELATMVVREAAKSHIHLKSKDENMCVLSGFFPKDENLIDRFVEKMKDYVKDVDVLGIWYPSMEEYIIATYMPDTRLSYLKYVEPYYFPNPWSRALKGKKVLVVHPFAETIKSQYEKRELLFENKDVLPDFELITLKAVQTVAGETDERFANWFEALDYMIGQMAAIDYDIAIIGCGAYGMPLAVEAKRHGKQAIHMGGATQLLFGIKGKRWDDTVIGKTLYNDYWVNPNADETPKKKNLVENGAYW